MSKIKHIHLFRNGTVLENRDKAVAKLNEFINGDKYDNLDGVAILARYKSANNGVQTLVGFVYGGDGTNSKSITIFDNEGSKSDTNTEINNLRKEIETQIQNTLTSANAHTNEEIAKLDVDDSPVDNNFVTSVSESDGKITVQRAAVASPTKTVSVTKADGGGVNFDVNIDGKTIVKNTDGKISVASAALTQYVGENAVTVSSADTSNNKTVSLKINSGDKVLSQDTNGLSTTLSIAYDSSTRKLQLKGKGGNLISDIDATAFVKDGMLNDTAVFTASATTQSITFGEKETITDPVPTGPVARVVPNSSNTHEYSGLTINHHYLAFEFKVDGDDTQPYKYEILDATDIIDVYKNGNGLELTDHTFSVKKADDSEGFLTIDEDGVKISGVADAIAAAAASAKTEVKKATDDQHIDVTSSATDGHVTYTISSKGIASATELTNVKNNVGLNEDGSHITTSGNYTSSATTVTGEIAALDTQVKKNETSITTLNSQVNEINGKIAKNAPKGSNAITVTEEADGSTIAIKLSATDSGLKIDESGLAIDFETLELDCGTY